VADLPARDPACTDACRPGRFGAPTASAGIAFCVRTDLTLIDLRGDPQNAEFLAGAQGALGCALPLKANTTARGPDCDVLWLGPDAWLLVSGQAGKINETLPINRGFLTDVSHGRAAFRISGPRTRDLLAKGCSLDLHPRAFQAGQCAQTSLAHVGVLLHLCGDGGEFDLYCARSYAAHLWHWLAEAASEYGYEVVAPVGLENGDG
jgi:heterotetrameric sarcosine oxidase gamma subunit